jgi:hypothetical protein
MKLDDSMVMALPHKLVEQIDWLRQFHSLLAERLHHGEMCST